MKQTRLRILLLLLLILPIGIKAESSDGIVLRFVRAEPGQLIPRLVEDWEQVIEARHPDGVKSIGYRFASGQKTAQGKVHTVPEPGDRGAYDPKTGYYFRTKRFKTAETRTFILEMETNKGEVIYSEPYTVTAIGNNPDKKNHNNVTHGIQDYSSFIDFEDGDVVEPDKPIYLGINCSSSVGKIEGTLHGDRPDDDDGIAWVALIIDGVEHPTFTDYKYHTDKARVPIYKTAGDNGVNPYSFGYYEFWDVNLSKGAHTLQILSENNEGKVSHGELITLYTSGDGDKDGLTDSWETKYFGDLSQSAKSDPDGDGYDNMTEWNLRSNPTQDPADIKPAADRTVVVDNHGGSTYSKIWKAWRLNTDTPLWYGQPAAYLVSGEVGAITEKDAFAFKASFYDDWATAKAKSASNLKAYLETLNTSAFGTKNGGNFGVDDAKDTGKAEKGRMDGSNEAVVFTVDTTGLAPWLRLEFSGLSFASYDSGSQTDFIIIDGETGTPTHTSWQQNFANNISGKSYPVNNGDQIIIATSADNTGSYQIETLSFKIVMAE